MGLHWSWIEMKRSSAPRTIGSFQISDPLSLSGRRSSSRIALFPSVHGNQILPRENINTTFLHGVLIGVGFRCMVLVCASLNVIWVMKDSQGRSMLSVPAGLLLTCCWVVFYALKKINIYLKIHKAYYYCDPGVGVGLNYFYVKNTTLRSSPSLNINSMIEYGRENILLPKDNFALKSTLVKYQTLLSLRA